MAPPRKRVEDGQVDVHISYVPLTTPFSFVSSEVLCYVVGNNVCLWNLQDGTREYVHTAVHSITKICGNAARGLVAFCEGGTSPDVFIYSVAEPRRLLHTVSGVTELELADLAFSRCGSRLYTLSRATAKRLCVVSTTTGEKLPGCDIELPLRFDKVSVYPGHKDRLALIRSSTVRVVTLQKSYETYIVRFHPSAIPVDVELSVSAYTWTLEGNFIFATRQGLLCTLDGSSGAVLHVCQAEQAVTSIVTLQGRMLLTAHIGNTLRVWQHDSKQLGSIDYDIRLANPPLIESETEVAHGVYKLRQSIDLDRMSQEIRPEHTIAGQVAHLQCMPDYQRILLTSAEGEVWSFVLPEPPDPSAVPEPPAPPPPPQPVVNEDFLGEEDEEEEEEEGAPEDGMSFEELDPKLLTWFHTHPVADTTFITKTLRLCASADEGGRLRIWEIARSQDPKGFRVLRFTSALTSLNMADEGTTLLVGTDSGCLHLVNCANWKRPYVADTLRISEAGIAKICSVPHQSKHAYVAASLFNHHIAFLSVGEQKLRMCGYVDCFGVVEDLCFHSKEHKADGQHVPKLLVVSAFSAPSGESWPCLWAVQAPPMDYEPTTPELRRDVCPIWSAKVGGELTLDERATAVASASKKAVAVGFASGAMKLFQVPSTAGPPAPKQPSSQATDGPESHSQLVTIAHTSSDGSKLLTASMDGAVRVASLVDSGRAGPLFRILHNPYSGGVVQARLDEDNLAVLSTGGSDGLFVWSGVGAPVSVSPPIEVEDPDDDSDPGYASEVDDKDLAAFPPWTPASNEEHNSGANLETEDPELHAVAVAQRKALLLEVEGLRKRLRILVDTNNNAPELEQLERADFCVDLEERDAIAEKTRERCNVLRAQIEKENVARQLIRDRLIKEFWDPMRTRGCQIKSFMGPLSVSNYPERTVSEEEEGTIRKLRTLRRVELFELQMLREADCPERLKSDLLLKAETFTTGRECYMVNWWPKDRKRWGGSDDAGASPLAGAADIVKQEQYLLYEPFELLSNARRRLQIHLLQALAADYREAFNKLFTACQQEKRATMSQINEKIARIRAILAELQIDEACEEPELHEREDAEAVLQVKDNEISVEKWISEEERRKKAEADAREAERQRQLRENDAGQRALMQMMGGTLKTKKDLSALEKTVEKEPWMDQIPLEEMTEIQRQAVKDFEERERALVEEQDKYRKQLDAELKKCRSDVQELMHQFELALKELHHQRFAHDAKSFCQDLYCVRLQLALLQSVEDSFVLKQLQEDLEKSGQKLAATEQTLQDFQENVAVMRDRQEERIRHEKEVSSAHNFRQTFANAGLEEEAIRTLLQMFRRKRPGAEKEKMATTGMGMTQRSMTGLGASPSLSRAPTSVLAPVIAVDDAAVDEGVFTDPFDAVTVGDPYADLGTQEPQGASEVSLLGEEPAEERPEHIPEGNFQRMLELRSDRYRAETEVLKGAAVLTEMGGLLAHYQRERDDAQADHDRLQAELSEHRQLMDREMYDIEIVFKLKQGQVEVPQAAVVTDYSDAVVIDTEVVESRNRRILELGKEKVSTLDTIKEFRKRLNLINWEHKHLALQTSDLLERTKDVHMLRATKGLQSLLKSGEEGRNKVEADLLERKIEHLQTTTTQKEQTLRKQHAASSHATKLRKMENSTLEKKLRELQQNVIQREHIRRLRAPQGGAAGQPGVRESKPRIVGGGGKIEVDEAAAKLAQQSFREVRTRQSLLDAAKKHTEEIGLLRKELDRLRQKTFPSFVQVHEDRPSNPDFAPR